MDHRKTYRSDKNSSFLQNCASHENFRVNSPKPFLQKKIQTNPKFQIPRKKNGNQVHKFIKGDHPLQNKINRVKSLNGENMMKVKNQGESVLEFYERENKNLTKQNQFLLKEVRKKKQSQASLLNYIDHLKQQISNLKVNSPRDKLRTAERTCIQTVGSSENIYPTFYQDQDRSEAEIQHMNIRFNKLMEECSKEKLKKEKLVKRQQIADIAERMKILRKNIDYCQ